MPFAFLVLADGLVIDADFEDSRLGDEGQALYGRVLAMRRRRLAELLDGWAP